MITTCGSQAETAEFLIDLLRLGQKVFQVRRRCFVLGTVGGETGRLFDRGVPVGRPDAVAVAAAAAEFAALPDAVIAAVAAVDAAVRAAASSSA